MSYKDLRSYQQAVIVYDFTIEFCNRYIDKASRTKDQMEQAARSGKQNIAEGSSEKTSEKSELYLLGIARASFQELLEDFEDFLRQRGFQKWDRDDPRSLIVRNLYKSHWSNKSNLSNQSNKFLQSSPYWSYLGDSEMAANAVICLIHQANFLLDRQIASLEKDFVAKGDYSENLKRKREDEKKRKMLVERGWLAS